MLTIPLQNMRAYYNSGATRSYQFRRQQLLLFKQALQCNEQAIYAALYADLKKSPEESYISENGLVLAEITTLLKNLHKWMKPQRVPTDMANWPGSSKIYRDPLGVVLITAPFNYPLQLALLPLAGAIAGGNCVVIKPSELAPATAAVIEKIITETFEPNYITVVQGDGAEVIPAMLNSFRFDHIFYTGSIPVGKAIYTQAAQQLIPVTLELGGKSPAVVAADADIAIAAKRIVMGKFFNAGQTCVAPDYVLVHHSAKAALLAAMQQTIPQFYGDNTATSYEYGKIINTRRFDKLVSYLGDGNIVTGGTHNREALYIAPTVIDDIKPGAAIMQEEIFGPLLPVLTFTTMDEAMAIVQQHANPLALYLFTGSKALQQQWINNVPFGGGCINNTVVHFTNHHLPFGGVGTSGMGAYHGRYSFNTFTRAKPVMQTPTWFNPKVKRPPFKGRMGFFKMFIK